MANLDPRNGGTGGAFATSGSGGGAAAGAGGQGSPWVNIQNYLNNSQGSTATSDILNNQVGGALQGEQDKFNTAANSADSQGAAAAQNPYASFSGKPGVSQYDDPASYSINNSTLNSSVDRAANRQVDPSNNTFDDSAKLQGATSGSYSGPQNFTWASDPVAQNFMKGVTNPDTFQQQYLPELYQQNAGQGFTPGQSALQSNIDANNPNVKAAFQGLNQKYGRLATDEASKIGSVNTDLGNDQKQAQGAAGAVRGGLGTYQGTNLNSINQAVTSDEGLRSGALANQPDAQANNTFDKNLLGLIDGAGSNTQSIQVAGPGFNGGWYTPTDARNIATAGENKYGPLANTDLSNAFDKNNVSGQDTQKNDYNYIASLLGQDPTNNIGFNASPYDTGKLGEWGSGAKPSIPSNPRSRQ